MTTRSGGDRRTRQARIELVLDQRGVRRLTQVLAAVVTGLLLLTVVTLALDYGQGEGRGVELELLNMGREGSLATWLAGPC